jgi:hypothetical protein
MGESQRNGQRNGIGDFMKKKYKEVVNNVISLLQDKFNGCSKREIINMVYDHINSNKLINDYAETSLYNTIYYFLRRRNIFKMDEIRYRFDSISSKLKFIDDVRNDIQDRWWFYKDLFFGSINRPILPPKTKVVSGSLDYIIESNKGPQFDFLYTLLYFRDTRKILSADMSNIIVKKELNEKLYTIMDDLYSMDDCVCEMILNLNDDQTTTLKSLMNQYFKYLSDFDMADLNGLHSGMVRNVNAFKRFITSTGNKAIFEYNKNRFFDTITFCNAVYICALQYLDLDWDFNQYRSIHYLVNATSYFVFFKFAKRLKNGNMNKLDDFFNSDLYFSYVSYVIKYYEMFANDCAYILTSAGFNSKSTLLKFDIILRYMLYNKFRNLVNSNIKRFIGCEFEIHNGAFLNMDDLNDGELFNSNLYTNPEPCREITLQSLKNEIETFFSERNGINRDDVMSIATDICKGSQDFKKYDPATIQAGRKLVILLKENVQTGRLK